MKFLNTVTILKIVHLLLGAVLFLIPVFFVPVLLSPFVEPRTFLFLALVEITAFFYLILAILKPEYRPKKNYVFYSFLIFLVVSIVSSFAGSDMINSFWSDGARFDTTIVLIHVFLFFLITSFTIKSDRVLNTLIWSSVLSSVLVAISVYLAYFNLFDYLYFGAKTSNNIDYGGLLSNESYAGVYLLFNVFFIIYLIFNTSNKIKRYVLKSILGIILLSPIFFNFDIFKGKVSLTDIISQPSLLLGSARAVGLSLGLSLFLMLCLGFIKSSNTKIRLFSKIAITLFFSILFFLSVAMVIPDTKANDWVVEKTGGNRFTFWTQAFEGFKERPLLGWGPGNFNLINEKYFDPAFTGEDYYASNSTPDKAHNIIFDTLATTGILGLLSYLSIFVLSLALLWRSKNIQNKNKIILTGLFFSYLLQNMFFFDVLVSYIMFAFLLAIIVVLESRDKDINQINTDSTISFSKTFVLTSLVILFLVISSLRYFVLLPVRESYLNFKFYNLAPNVRGFYLSERNLSPYGGSKTTEVYAASVFNWYLGNYGYIKQLKDPRPYILDIDNVIKDIINNSKNGKVTFFGAHYVFQLSDIKYQLTQDESILPVLDFYAEQGIALSPNNIHPYINKGRVLFYQKKYKEAVEVLEKALSLTPTNPKLHFLIVDVARFTGDKKFLKEKIRRAEIYLPINK